MSLWVLVAIGLGLFLGARCFVVVNTGLTAAGVRAEFMEQFDATAVEYEQLSTRIPSSTQTEHHRWLGSVPQMREWGTGRLAKGLRSESYDVTNGEYESTIEVDRKEIEDDQVGGIRLRIREMAEAAKNHKDYLIEELLKNGATSGFNGYDGVSFFNANHVSGDSGAQSNIVTATAVDADAPTRAEFLTSIGAAIARMVAIKDDTGQPRRIKATGLVCVVPSSMYITALEAINQTLAGAGLDPNQKNILQNVARVVTMPGLSTASRYYVLKTDVPVRPFIFQDRMAIDFQALEEGSDPAFKRGLYLYGTRARYAMAYGNWFYAMQVDFSEA